MNRSGILVLAVLLALASSTHATWNRLARISTHVSCGYFVDAQHGFVGSGYRTDFSSLAQIYLTTDGGASWTTSTTPAIYGAVTSICMIDASKGYASIFAGSSALWMTTDGGFNWTDISPAGFAPATSVYAHGNVVALTTWSDLNGISTDGGVTWRAGVFGDGTVHSNMVTFTNALHGVTVTGPTGTSYVTSDGGATWFQPSTVIPEGWSVFADTQVNAFYLANEGLASSPLRTILRSSDNGVTWNASYTFADPHLTLTGHIAGAAGRLYIQTVSGVSGLYRSDDGGLSWKPIGGPFGARDMRFAVSGCNGEVIYAFDDSGGVWQTTDGGDGTLQEGKLWSELHPANLSAPAGDTITIPVYASSNLTKPFVISKVGSDTIALILNTDLLTPVGFDSTFAPLTVQGLNYSGDTVFLTINDSGVTIADTVRLGNLRLLVRVAPVLHTSVTLRSSSVAASVASCMASDVTDDSVLFTLAPRCGDSLLWMLLSTGGLELRMNPNPATTLIHCELTGLSGGTPTVTILDRLGRTVMTETTSQSKFDLDTQSLPAGIYVLVVSLDGLVARGKLVVDR